MSEPSDFDRQVAIRTLAQEARNQPLAGQEGVAWIMRNRLATGRWGKSLSSVCLWNAHIPQGGQGFQFSGWRGQDSNFAYACGLTDADPILTKMRAVLDGVLAADPSSDPTKAALFYYATSMAPPYWVDESKFCVQIGAHRFYTGAK